MINSNVSGTFKLPIKTNNYLVISATFRIDKLRIDCLVRYLK